RPPPGTAAAASWDRRLEVRDARLESRVGQALARLVELAARVEQLQQTDAPARVQAAQPEQVLLAGGDRGAGDRQALERGAPPPEQVAGPALRRVLRRLPPDGRGPDPACRGRDAEAG